ncbi:MAG: tail fiber protein, partial [Bacteroidota bacterium]
MDAFLGEIRMFAGTFAPEYWAFCHGQVLQINDNAAL